MPIKNKNRFSKSLEEVRKMKLACECCLDHSTCHGCPYCDTRNCIKKLLADSFDYIKDLEMFNLLIFNALLEMSKNKKDD